MTALLGVPSPPRAGADFEGAGVVYATKLTANASGVVDSVTIRFASTNTFAGTLNIGIYADSAGTPGARLGNAVTMTVATGPGERKSASGIAASVTLGTAYWIAAEGSAQFDFETSSGNAGTGGTAAGSKDTVGGQTGIPASWPTTSGTYAETASFWAEDALSVAYTKARMKVVN